MKNEGLSRDECARTKVQAQPSASASASARCRWLGGGMGEREGGNAGEKWKEGGSRWTGRQGRE